MPNQNGQGQTIISHFGTPSTDIIYETAWHLHGDTPYEAYTFIDAGAGDDVIFADNGWLPVGTIQNKPFDIIQGGEGVDLLSYIYSYEGVNVNLGNGIGYRWGSETTPNTPWGGVNTDAEYDEIHGIENVTGTHYYDQIVGDGGDNVLHGLNGHDRLKGNGGDDGLFGGNGADRLWGDAGGDTINGGNGRDRIRGGDDNDEIHGGGGGDRAWGDDGNDEMHGDAGRDYLRGGVGADTIWGGDDDDRLYGDAGHDFLYGDAGFNRLYGGGGNDALVVGERGVAEGGAGDDVILGGDKVDRLEGGAQDDEIYAGAGNDKVYGGTGDDIIDGSDGIDTAYFEIGAASVVAQNGGGYAILGDEGFDVLTNVEILRLASGDDIIVGNQQVQTAYGGGGNDAFDMGGGDDHASGDAGNDTLLGGAGNDGLDGGDGDDLIEGGSGQDGIIGGDGADTLDGGMGNDAISGGSGNDVIRGGMGADGLEGGEGADVFVWETGDTGLDRITDFAVGEDRIDIDALLLSLPEIGETYAGQVIAHAADGGMSSRIFVDGAGGWEAVVTLTNVHVATAQAAIADSTLFTGDVQTIDVSPEQAFQGAEGMQFDSDAFVF